MITARALVLATAALMAISAEATTSTCRGGTPARSAPRPPAVAPESATKTARRLPFGITSKQLLSVAILFRVTSTKINSGWDEIVIAGNGDVRLRTADMSGSRPRELRGRVAPVQVTRLLKLLEDEGIERWDDEYPPQSAHYVVKRLVIGVKNVPRKEVTMAREEFPEFSRCCGAIKLLAGIARPEALGGGFFQRI